MRKNLENELSELIEAKVIDLETGVNIRDYYERHKVSTQAKVFIIFGVLGTLFIGLGVILVLAHNWDELSNLEKSFVAFSPLLAAQAICAYVIYKKYDSEAWRESCSLLLFLLFGSCLAIILRTYNSPDSFNIYLLKWITLMLPMIYLLRSSVTSIMYLILLTAFGMINYTDNDKYIYWVLFATLMPHYYILLKSKKNQLFSRLHNWLIPISLLLMLGSFSDDIPSFMLIAYISLYAIFYLIGNLDIFSMYSWVSAYLFYGTIGTIFVLFIFSYDGMWQELDTLDEIMLKHEIFKSPELALAIVVSLAALVLLILRYKKIKSAKEIDPMHFVFLIMIMIFIIAQYIDIAAILTNILILVVGTTIIIRGYISGNLAYMNMGLVIITVLITLRFFDIDLSFIIRGIFFILIGICFLMTNILMAKYLKKKSKVALET